ncbi:MAG: SAM-dependent chlorinase/fluorinase [Prochloraceae cyanobacterium]|nr:SAM-dependent chlorinase/fluorinase [Prochloraceae cyanobacterium]
MSSTITLLSDFGLQDVYVGVMKGIIAQIDPGTNIIDLTHQIPPQNLAAARFCLLNAIPYFPPRTVHIAIVDPGVGNTKRRGVAIEFSKGFLVGPDNGIFSGILSLYPPTTAVELTNSQYWLTANPSNTFHGRDIFAPVGGYLANEVNIRDLGPEIELNSLVNLAIPAIAITDTGIIGSIQYIDRFGNLITNIPEISLKNKNWGLKLKNEIVLSSQTYSDRLVGRIVAIIGSHGWVEIAVNSGNARSTLGANWGDRVEIVFLESDNN